MNPDAFAQRLMAWQRRHGRHDLPWQCEPTPYRVWVSEIMLQQTRVATVVPYFQRFMERFPTLADLAAASLDDVLASWSGLGYYSRARNLHRSAVICRDRHDGELPEDFDALVSLPGIGRSTAGAIQALARNRPCAILDGNARRVLARFHAVPGWPGRSGVANRLWALAEAHTPARDAARYTQAIMDLGASVCTRTSPDCPACPLSAHCKARIQGNPEAYPGRKPPGRRPHRATTMLILTDGRGRVLMERRPPSGVWGGLWSLPEVDATQSPERAAENAGYPVREARRLEILRHGFTHYTLDIHPVAARFNGSPARIMDSDAARWLEPAEALDLGLPQPVRRLLQQFAEPTCREPSTA